MRVTFDSAFPADKLAGVENDVIVFLRSATGFDAERRLTALEVEVYHAATAFLDDITEGSHLIDASRINLAEFDNTFAQLIESTQRGASDPASTHHGLELNRRLSNYLSSFRLFLDFSEARLKRRYGKTSTEAQQFKRVCAGVYDTSFAYRFCCKLRNYAQHFGMPIGHIEARSRLDPGPPERPLHEVSVMFSTLDLLNVWPDGVSCTGFELYRVR